MPGFMLNFVSAALLFDEMPESVLKEIDFKIKLYPPLLPKVSMEHKLPGVDFHNIHFPTSRKRIKCTSIVLEN